MVRDVVVYALVDPRDGLARYVGRSVNPGARLMGHLSEARWSVTERSPGVSVRTAKESWLLELEALRLLPDLVLLETVGAWEGALAEQEWIYGCLEMGDPLLNARDAYGARLVREGGVACAAC